MMLPSTLTEILQLINSLRRIGELLDAEELTDVNQRLPAQESSESTEVGEDDAFELQDGFEAKLTTEALPSLFPSDSFFRVERSLFDIQFIHWQREVNLGGIRASYISVTVIVSEFTCTVWSSWLILGL